jgi:hypothetical protein
MDYVEHATCLSIEWQSEKVFFAWQATAFSHQTCLGKHVGSDEFYYDALHDVLIC